MKKHNQSALKQASNAIRPNLLVTVIFSFLINILMLAGPLYMLQVYDRVLPSSSIDTLVALSVMLLGLFAVMGTFELIRSRVLSRSGTQLEALVAPAVFDANIRKRAAEPSDDGVQSLGDLGTVRDFLSGNGLPAFFDLPWVPVYLIILALLHPVLGMLGVAGTAILFSMAWCNDRLTRKPTSEYATIISKGNAVAEASNKNAEVLQAMGMLDSLRRSWLGNHARADVFKSKANERSALFTVTSKTFRLVLQSAALGVGAALVITDGFTAGSMIAGTIILGRGLAPVDQSIAHWRSYIAARGASARLETLLTSYPEPERRIVQNDATSRLDVERVFAGAPGARKPIVSGINFSLYAGEAMALLGPSASGKSTLARLLTGIWMPQAGNVRLDGVALDQWNAEQRGQQIGYLPQDIELFDGTIAQNIARFQVDATDMEVIAAAQAAGVHEAILQLADGYETRVGEGGKGLSGGQKQRLGLARALFREPFLTVLDEPNANLDSDGDMALGRAIAGIKQRGGIAIVISHRPGIADAVDKMLILHDGQQRAFGPAEQIMAQNTQPAVAASPSNVTPITAKHKTAVQ